MENRVRATTGLLTLDGVGCQSGSLPVARESRARARAQHWGVSLGVCL